MPDSAATLKTTGVHEFICLLKVDFKNQYLWKSSVWYTNSSSTAARFNSDDIILELIKCCIH